MTGRQQIAHVYERVRVSSPHAAAVRSAPWLGPIVVVRGNRHDGWREYGGGFNLQHAAEQQSAQVSAQVVVHVRAAA